MGVGDMRGTVKNEVVEDLVGTEEGIVWNSVE